MESSQDAALFLARILDELDGGPDAAPCPDLCHSPCAHPDLAQLALLRRALLRSAGLDPRLPAALPQDEAAGCSQRPKKATEAADVAARLSLGRTSGGVRDIVPAGRQGAPPPEPACPTCRPGQRPFVPAAQPSFLLRPGQLDRLRGPAPCEMQRTCFPARPGSPPTAEPASPARAQAWAWPRDRPGPAEPRAPQPGLFRGDLPGPAATRGGPQRCAPRKAASFNHSFELPPRGRCSMPGARPARHESLGDLQASTYFGPSRGAREARPRPWPAKSRSLGAEEAPDAPRPLLPGSPSEARPGRPGPGRQRSSDTSSVGTQTEPPAAAPGPHPGPRGGRPADEASEAASEDISDLFRFLDDVSVSSSAGRAASSCRDSSPEPGPARDRPPREALRTSLGRLARRVGEVERRLEALAGVRAEVAQVLARLQRLDRPQGPRGRPGLDSGAGGAPSDSSVSPSDGSASPPAARLDWARADTGSGSSERPPTPGPRAPRDWRTVTCPGRVRPAEAEEAQRQPRAPHDGVLEELVFSPRPRPPARKARATSSALYADMRLTARATLPRGPPPWAGDKAKLGALDLQAAPDPGHLRFWVEAARSPGQDALLRRKEAAFRRAKACKMAALVAAAACTVVLVIVVPLCTAKP